MSLNHIVAMGRMAKNPEVKQTQSGVSVCNFTIACDRDFKNGDEKITDWIDCVAWRNTADFLGKYVTKGRNIVVSGSLQSRKWEDKEGNKRTSWEIQVQNVYFADSKRDGDGGGQTGGYQNNSGYGPQEQQFTEEENNGELPF